MALQNIVSILAHMRKETADISAAAKAKELQQRQEAEAALQELPSRIVIRGTGTAFKQSMGASRRPKTAKA